MALTAVATRCSAPLVCRPRRSAATLPAHERDTVEHRVSQRPTLYRLRSGLWNRTFTGGSFA